MKGMVLDKPAPAEENPLRLREIPVPGPKAGEVRLRVLTCGVCRTDLHLVEGDLPLPKLPIVVGHQVVGVVEAVGAGVEQPNVGDRVGVAWLYSTCGE